MIKFIRSLISIGGHFTHGYVLQAWWLWFLVPKGLPPLPFLEAVLLRVAIFAFTRPPFDVMEVPANLEKRVEYTMFYTFLLPATLYLFGWSIKTFFIGA